MEKDEIKKFLSLLLETSNFLNEEETNFENFFNNLYPILDKEQKGFVRLIDFIRVTKENDFLEDLIKNYSSIISYKVELDKHKIKNENEIDQLDQVAGKFSKLKIGHSGGLKSIVLKGIIINFKKR
jgi:hypothetical protein